jgi:hypothetical protein
MKKQKRKDIFYKINVHLIEYFGDRTFHVGDSLEEYGFKVTIKQIIEYPNKYLFIVS